MLINKTQSLQVESDPSEKEDEEGHRGSGR